MISTLPLSRTEEVKNRKEAMLKNALPLKLYHGLVCFGFYCVAKVNSDLREKLIIKGIVGEVC